MKMQNEALINDLIQRVKGNLNEAENLLQLSDVQLNKRPAPEKWSALECIDHLCRYGDFYIPEITNRLKSARKVSSSATYSSGFLGNKFAEMMLPKEKLNKMSTFKNMNPMGSKLDRKVIQKFINQQKEMLQLLDRSRTADLTRTKNSITISKMLKLRLGDTFRVLIYHDQRHIEQAKRAIAS